MNTKGIKFLAVLAVLAMAFAAFAVIADIENDDASATVISGPDFLKKTGNTVAEVSESSGTTTYKLTVDVELSSTPTIVEDVIIDMNDHNITTSSGIYAAFYVDYGTLEFVGKGKVSNTASSVTQNGLIWVGYTDGETVTKKASAIIGEDVELSTNYCYALVVAGKNVSGQEVIINGYVHNNVSGSDVAAVSGNGSSFYTETKITIGETGKLESTYGGAIYHPQAGTLTINGTIIGGIEVKSGEAKVEIGSNADISANGQDKKHVSSNDGNSTNGYAIAVVENNGYPGNPSITINDGKITGDIILAADTASDKKSGSITINGGTIDGSFIKEAATTGSITVNGGYFKDLTVLPYISAGKSVTLVGKDTVNASTLATPKTTVKEGTTLNLATGSSLTIKDVEDEGTGETNVNCTLINNGTINVEKGAALIGWDTTKPTAATGWKTNVLMGLGAKIEFDGSNVDPEEVKETSGSAVDEAIEKAITDAGSDNALIVISGATVSADVTKTVNVGSKDVAFVGKNNTVSNLNISVGGATGTGSVSFSGFASFSGKVTTTDGTSTQTITLISMAGSFTISKGSVIIDGKEYSGEITLDPGVEVKMSGSIKGSDFKVSYSGTSTDAKAKVIIENGADKALEIIDHKLIIDSSSVELQVDGKLFGEGIIESKGNITVNDGGELAVAEVKDFKGTDAATNKVTITANAGSIVSGKILLKYSGASKSTFTAYSGSDINGLATDSTWGFIFGKDAAAGTWSYDADSGKLTLNNYDGTYNFRGITNTATSITSIDIVGTNKVTYVLPVGFADDEIFGNDTITGITTDETGSLTIAVDYSNVAQDELDDANVIISAKDSFTLNGVTLVITVTGTNTDWTETKDIKLTAINVIDGAADLFKMYSATLSIDAFSAYAAENVKGVVLAGEDGKVDIKNSSITILSAGYGLNTASEVVADNAMININVQKDAIAAGTKAVSFNSSSVSIISDDNGIVTTGAISFDSTGAEIKVTTAAIDGANAITVLNSNIDVAGDVTIVESIDLNNQSDVSIVGKLSAKRFTMIKDSVLTVKDLYVTGVYNADPAADKSSKITKGTFTLTGNAVVIGDIINEATFNNEGTVGLFGVFTNNATLNNTGNFYSFAKEANVVSDNNNSITITDGDAASSDKKARVQSITLSNVAGDVVMNADGTVSVKNVTIAFKDDAAPIALDAKDKFYGTLAIADLVKADQYYTLDLTNGTATVKVIYKKITEGAADKIGKSYEIGVAGRIVDTAKDEYELEANEDGKAVDDKVRKGTGAAGTQLIIGAASNFITNNEDADSVITSTGSFVLYDSATKTIAGKYTGDMTTYFDTVIGATFKGDLASNGTVKVSSKKTFTGDIESEKKVTVAGTLKGNIVTLGDVEIEKTGTIDGNVTVTTTEAKKVTVSGKFVGDLTFNSKYLAKSTDKEGEETVTTHIMNFDADMSPAKSTDAAITFEINLTGAKNATTTSAGEPGFFTMGTTPGTPLATKAVKLTLTQGVFKVPSSLTLPVRYNVIIEKDTTIEVGKNMVFNVEAGALKVSNEATSNFETGSGVSVTYGKVSYIMSFETADGYKIYSNVAYALSNCDEGQTLTVGKATTVTENVIVKDGVNIIVDGVKLDFSTFGLKMGEGAKITLKGAGNLAFGVTGDNKAGLAADEEYEYYSITGIVEFDEGKNVLGIYAVRFSAPSTIKGVAATSTTESKIEVDLTFNQGAVGAVDGIASGKVALQNDHYYLTKADETAKKYTLVCGSLTVSEGAVFEASSLTDMAMTAKLNEVTNEPEITMMPTVVVVNGTLYLSNSITVNGIYSGEGVIVLAKNKDITIPQASVVDIKDTTDDYVYGGTFTGKVTNGLIGGDVITIAGMMANIEAGDKVVLTAYESSSEAYFKLKGQLLCGVTASDEIVLDGLTIDDDANVVAETVKIVNASAVTGELCVKEIDADSLKKLTYDTTYEALGYTVYTVFENIDWDVISDVTLAASKKLSDFGIEEGKKLDLSGRDVNITIAEGKTLTLDRPLIIGTPIDDLGDEGSSISGKIVIGVYVANTSYDNAYLIAYSDVDLTEAEIYGYDGKTAAVYSVLDIEDIPYAKIFANENGLVKIAGDKTAQVGQVLATVDKSIVPEIEGYVFTKWYNYDETEASFVGQTNAYAGAKAVTVFVTVKFVTGITYYCNGIEFAIYDTPTKVDYNSVFTAKISDTSKYQGTPLVNGKNSLIITDDVEIVGSGVTPIPVPPEPEPEPVVGDSGLSLTDILLIVLVILIAIMVVILVLRLNRS